MKQRTWMIILTLLGAFGMFIFLLNRCDFRSMRWIDKSPIVTPHKPTAPPTPTPTPMPEPAVPSPSPTPVPIAQAPIMQDGAIIDDGTIDDRASDPKTLSIDADIVKGDENVETTLGVLPFSLHKVFPSVGGNLPDTLISFGSHYFGTPYQYGSDRNSPNTFDCSDFTHWSYWKGLGMDIPRDSRSQWTYVSQFGSRKFYDIHQAQKGDLLFFMSYRGWRPENYAGINKNSQTITHVGMYLGNGKMLHTASAASGGVRIDYVFGKQLEWRFLRGGSVL